MAVRFLHTSDWQLGMTRAFLSAQGQSRYTDDQFEAMRSLARLASERACAFVVVAGDVFDSIRPTRQIMNKAIDALASFQVPVLLLPGNHDADTPAGVWATTEFADRLPAGVKVIRDTTPITLAGGAVEVIGAPWPSRKPDADLLSKALAGVEPPPPGVVRVAVGHGGVDSLSPDRLDPALISTSGLERAIAQRLVSYVALGDRHSVTQVAPAIWYSGAPLATDYGEVASNRALIVDLDGDSVSVDTVEVGSWHFLVQQFDLIGRESVERVERFLDGLEHKERTVIKLGLVGTLSLAERDALEGAIERARDLLAGLQLSASRSEVVVVADDDDFSSLHLSGFAREAMAELASQARTQGEGASVAQDALMLLARLAGRSS
jgi:DNA repair exonuclease SbcCD nuclease subunit